MSVTETCSGCGRPFTNWTDQGSAFREHGLKVEQQGPADRIADYRSWRMRWGLSYVNDVPDQIEYAKDGTPVAALELTRCDLAPGYASVPSGYLSAVWDRFTERDLTQYRSLKLIADRLGIPAFLVVYEASLASFYLREVDSSRWVTMRQSTYRSFITSLRPKVSA